MLMVVISTMANTQIETLIECGYLRELFLGKLLQSCGLIFVSVALISS